MKTLGLIATAIVISSSVFAQSAEKNQHGVTVSSTAKSETAVSTNRGEIVSSTASLNSQSSVHSAKHTTHNNDAKREDKEAAAANRSEAKANIEAAIGAKKEALNDRKEQTNDAVEAKKETVHKHSANVKAKAEGTADLTLNATKEVAGEISKSVRADVNHAKAVHAEGSVNSATKAQLRRSGITGRVGAAAGLRL